MLVGSLFLYKITRYCLFEEYLISWPVHLNSGYSLEYLFRAYL